MGEVLNFVDGTACKPLPEVKRKNKGKKKGESSMVQPIKKPNDLKKFLQYFKNQTNTAKTDYKKIVTCRNYLLIIIGLNTAYRISDIVSLRWEDLISQDGKVVGNTRRQAKKTGKYVDGYINSLVQDAINYYFFHTKTNPMDLDLSEYIFTTCRSGDTHMTEVNAYSFIKAAAKAVGLSINVGTHTLRKTYGYHYLMGHKEDNMALTNLMYILGHSSQAMTLHYIGFSDEDYAEIGEEVATAYRSIITGERQAILSNLVKISKNKINELLSFAYELGMEYAEVQSPSAHEENLNELKGLAKDYFV